MIRPTEVLLVFYLDIQVGKRKGTNDSLNAMFLRRRDFISDKIV